MAWPRPRSKSFLSHATMSPAFGGKTTLRGSSSSASGGQGKTSSTMTLNGQTANDHGTKEVPRRGAGSTSRSIASPSTRLCFTGHTGGKLNLTRSNESTATHNFNLPDQNIDTDNPSNGKVP
jgi:hypothetical protein